MEKNHGHYYSAPNETILETILRLEHAKGVYFSEKYIFVICHFSEPTFEKKEWLYGKCKVSLLDFSRK